MIRYSWIPCTICSILIHYTFLDTCIKYITSYLKFLHDLLCFHNTLFFQNGILKKRKVHESCPHTLNKIEQLINIQWYMYFLFPLKPHASITKCKKVFFIPKTRQLSGILIISLLSICWIYVVNGVLKILKEECTLYWI